jgi:hypothetical protein
MLPHEGTTFYCRSARPEIYKCYLLSVLPVVPALRRLTHTATKLAMIIRTLEFRQSLPDWCDKTGFQSGRLLICHTSTGNQDAESRVLDSQTGHSLRLEFLQGIIHFDIRCL